MGHVAQAGWDMSHRQDEGSALPQHFKTSTFWLCKQFMQCHMQGLQESCDRTRMAWGGPTSIT
eukprot:152240-Chlamydomonas_euryale.AAC.2